MTSSVWPGRYTVLLQVQEDGLPGSVRRVAVGPRQLHSAGRVRLYLRLRTWTLCDRWEPSVCSDLMMLGWVDFTVPPECVCICACAWCTVYSGLALIIGGGLPADQNSPPPWLEWKWGSVFTPLRQPSHHMSIKWHYFCPPRTRLTPLMYQMLADHFRKRLLKWILSVFQFRDTMHLFVRWYFRSNLRWRHIPQVRVHTGRQLQPRGVRRLPGRGRWYGILNVTLRHRGVTPSSRDTWRHHLTSLLCDVCSSGHGHDVFVDSAWRHLTRLTSFLWKWRPGDVFTCCVWRHYLETSDVMFLSGYCVR